tara:strand:+ start:289 stop:471 length:183 start_codon:yes stop_codon:yes gene_type:complete
MKCKYCQNQAVVIDNKLKEYHCAVCALYIAKGGKLNYANNKKYIFKRINTKPNGFTKQFI